MELIRALKDVPLVTVNIQTVAEATIAASAAPQVRTDAENQPTATFSDEQPVIPVRNNRTPIQGQLERYFEQLYGGANSGQAAEEKAALHLYRS